MVNRWGIHRHTGGLEMYETAFKSDGQIHRHTGGLEIFDSSASIAKVIHRHTGGLEKLNKPYRLAA